MANFIPISEAAEHLDMRPVTIQNMIRAGTLTGFVDWDEVQAKLIPTRPRQR
jgi:hypothetical protein